MINEAAMQIFQASAIINGMEALANEHEQGESDQTLVDIKLLCRSARSALEVAINKLDQPTKPLV